MSFVRDKKWNIFHILPPKSERICQMVTYQEPDQEVLFFGHSVAYCLGHDYPNRVQIPQEFQIRPRHASGVYLNADGVRHLAAGKQNFLDWLAEYLTQCNSDDPQPPCPS